MGNKLGKEKENKNRISREENLRQKDGLYSDKRVFRDYESKENFNKLKDTKIFGMKLDSDPERREYYYTCINCGKLLLDKGIKKELK